MVCLWYELPCSQCLKIMNIALRNYFTNWGFQRKYIIHLYFSSEYIVICPLLLFPPHILLFHKILGPIWWNSVHAYLYITQLRTHEWLQNSISLYYYDVYTILCESVRIHSQELWVCSRIPIVLNRVSGLEVLVFFKNHFAGQLSMLVLLLAYRTFYSYIFVCWFCNISWEWGKGNIVAQEHSC